jgi:hypothetical protein
MAIEPDYSTPELHRVFLWHKPSQRWVGYFQTPGHVTQMAVTENHLWLAAGHCAMTADGMSNPLVVVEKARLLATPESQWVGNEPTAAECAARLGELSPSDVVRYAFLTRDYARVIALLTRRPDGKPLDPNVEDGIPAGDSPLEYLLLLAHAYHATGELPTDAVRRYIMAQYERFPEKMRHRLREDVGAVLGLSDSTRKTP